MVKAIKLGWPRGWLVGAAALLGAACDDAADEPASTAADRAETICSEQCAKGATCGLLDGCISYKECRDGCVEAYERQQVSDACLDGIEVFHACFWRSLSCEQLWAWSQDPGDPCLSELFAIDGGCTGGTAPFDTDVYVFIPFFCVYGPG